VVPIDDTEREGNERVVVTLVPNPAYVVGLPDNATVMIGHSDQQQNPKVTVATADTLASESGPHSSTFIISRDGGTTSALTVKYSLGGTAVNGTDYELLSGTVIIPAGESSASVSVVPIADSTAAGSRTVVLTLSPDPAYDLGSSVNAAPGQSDSAMVIIAVNEPTPSQGLAAVSVSASIAIASEPGTDAGAFTVTRSGGLSIPLTVHYTLGGTAVNGVDYQALTGSVTIPAGSRFATIVVEPIDDNLVEGPESVIMTISADASYRVDVLNSATVTIIDNDLL
jgi:hypothetical protein